MLAMLRAQRNTERSWVDGFAYAGVVLAVLGGLAVVLGVPYLREHLLAAAIVYALILLIGSRMAAGFLGGYYGDRIGFERARARLLERWTQWLSERDALEVEGRAG